MARLVQFLKAYLYGDLDKLFKPLQDEIRKMPGYEAYKQEVVIFQEDFYECLDVLGKYLLWARTSYLCIVLNGIGSCSTRWYTGVDPIFNLSLEYVT